MNHAYLENTSGQTKEKKKGRCFFVPLSEISQKLVEKVTFEGKQDVKFSGIIGCFFPLTVKFEHLFLYFLKKHPLRNEMLPNPSF